MTEQPAAGAEPIAQTEATGGTPEGRRPDAEAVIAALEARVRTLETAVDELREEVDETRRDGRRVAELYDLVFERLKSGQL